MGVKTCISNTPDTTLNQLSLCFDFFFSFFKVYLGKFPYTAGTLEIIPVLMTKVNFSIIVELEKMRLKVVFP